MKLRNATRHLSGKAIDSMTTAVTSFNSPQERGRVTTVLLHLQHAFEMLLKAALVQHGVKVMGTDGRSIGFERCVREAIDHPKIKVTNEEAGTLRTIDALRDDEQHWFSVIEEGLLYLHARAAITLFDDLLHRTLEQRLADSLPPRVLPIGTELPQDFFTLVKKEYENIAELLTPGRRARAEAERRIRALLAMESHSDPDSIISEADVRRVIRGVQDGKSSEQVFPKLEKVGASVSGEGPTIEVRFSKKEGMPVRFTDEENVDVAAIRTVDLQKKYHRTASSLASSLGLTTSRSTALRRHLGINDDAKCTHTFVFGKQSNVRFSDNAFTRMKDAIGQVDMDKIWDAHAPVKRKSGPAVCGQLGCVLFSGKN